MLRCLPRKILHDLERLPDQRFALVVAMALLAGILGLFLPVSFFGMQQVIQHSETLDTQKEVGWVIGMIENELNRLERLNRDWSAWDDTYRFIQDGNQDYIDSNLNEESLVNLEINFFLITDNRGQVKILKIIDLEQRKISQAPFKTRDLLQKYPALLENKDSSSSHKGIAVVEDQAMLLSSLPILTSQGEGPVAGSLVVGIFLDQTEKEALSRLAQKEIAFWLSGQFPRLEEAGQAEASGAPVAVRPLDEKIIAGYQALEDLNGQPGVIVQVYNPRDFYRQGRNISIFFTAVFAALSVLLAAIVYRLVLSYMRTRRKSRQALERFRAIFDQSRDAILLVDPGGKILDANPSSLKMLKLEKDDVQRVSLNDILASDVAPLEQLFQHNEGNGSRVSEYHCHLGDGTHIDLEVGASEVRHLGIKAYSTILRDVTARKEAQEALRASEERYQMTTRGANDGLWDWDILTNQVFFSSRWKAMLGFQDEEISSSLNEWLDRVHPDDRIQLKSKLDEHLNKHTEHFEYEHRMLHKDGDYRWMLTRGVAVWNTAGFAQRMAGSQTDITRRKTIEEQLRYDALHDALTGLGNRTLLLERIKHVNQRKMRKPELLFALLFMDLDRFKQVNDTFGHRVGDQLLIETSRRLEGNLRSVDTVVRVTGPETLARIAGDEFVILLEDMREAEDAKMIADRILGIMAQPFNINGREILINLSIGIVIPDAPYQQPEDMIRDADIAMYKAKQKGGASAVLFSQEMYDLAAAHMQLEYELRRAVERGELLLHYQPIFALDDDHVIGFEALVRWENPYRGLLMPKDFIELAEETGLIVPMGYEILRKACTQMKQWQQLYGLAAKMIMSVNLSTRQLASPDLLARLNIILEETGFDPKSLWLEITETTLIENLDTVQKTLVELRKMGIHIEIDDFGMGYSSLSYLQNLPIDGFKIDRSFIDKISSSGQQIVNTLVELGKSLHLQQVAEGVETEEQRNYLRSLSCEYMQGYLMAKPMSAERIEAFLSELILKPAGN